PSVLALNGLQPFLPSGGSPFDACEESLGTVLERVACQVVGRLQRSGGDFGRCARVRCLARDQAVSAELTREVVQQHVLLLSAALAEGGRMCPGDFGLGLG